MPKCRWTDGPRTDNVEPIMVVFESKEEKDELWTKLSMKVVDDIVKKRSSIAITNVSVRRCVGKHVLDIYTVQDSSQRRRAVIERNCRQCDQPGQGGEGGGRRTAVVKPMSPSKHKQQTAGDQAAASSPTKGYNKRHGIKCELNIFS